MTQEKTKTEIFIEKARKIHGDKYDYSKAEYINARTKTCIICPKHGEFWQSPDSHNNQKRGCPKCGVERCHKGRKKWSKEKIHQEAAKYKTSNEFKFANGGAWAAAQKMGILKELRQYYIKNESQYANYWNLERAKEAAKKCHTRTQLLHDYPRAYYLLSKHNLLGMFYPNLRDSNEKVHAVYRYFFPQTNAVYIGRTLMNRIAKRDYEHKTNKNSSTVFKYALKEKLPIPNMEVMIDNITCTESLLKENEFIESAKKNGLHVLNIAKTGVKSGSIGALGAGKLTRDFCYSIAKTCATKHEFELKNHSAYLKANKKGWSKDYTWFKEVHKPKSYWDNYDNCYAEFIKCGSDLETLRKQNSTCHKHSVKNGFTKNWHQKRIAPNKKWTEETLKEIVAKYPTSTELQKHEGGAYKALRRMNLLYKYYPRQNDKPFGYWNVFENVQKEAQKYTSRWDFGKHNGSAYDAARRNKWIDKLFPNK